MIPVRSSIEMTEKDIILSKWLQGEVSDEEVQRQFDGIDLEYLRSTLDKQEKLEVTATDPSLQWDIFESKMSKTEIKASRSPIIKWIVLGVLLLAGALFLFFNLKNSNTTIAPKSNEFEQYAFEDGSEVRLWPGSAITFDESTYLSDRYIKLDGEAFFDVQKGASFRVNTPAGEIQVLGTSFNVWSADRKNTEVKCYSGSVRVTDNYEKEVVLSPGEKVTITDNRLTRTKTFDVNQQKAKGSLKHYDKAKAKWVIEDLENLYNIEVNIPNDLANQRFSGAIPLVELDQSFIYLCETMQWFYEAKNEVITIKHKE